MRVAFLPDGALIQSVKALNPQAMGSASKVMHILLDEDMKLLQACCKPSSYEICVSKKTIRLPCYLWEANESADDSADLNMVVVCNRSESLDDDDSAPN